jgi:protein TonB
MPLSGGELIAPTAVPSRIVILKKEPLPPEIGNGVASGVPGGVPGGQLGGVIGGVISDASRTNLPMPVPAAVQPKAPIRVGGRVRTPRVLSKPSPVYPRLAKQTRVQGIVSNDSIDAVIDTEGNVVEMSVVSGHPLLISAALDTVKNWKYEPTYLNDQAVAVQLIVTVTFQLDR